MLRAFFVCSDPSVVDFCSGLGKIDQDPAGCFANLAKRITNKGMPILSSIIGGIGALGSAIYGGIKSSQANKRAQQLIQQQRDENRRWYNTKMSQDYTLRTDVQNAINRQRELLDEQIKRANARQVVGGGSDESAALAKEAANKSVADATAYIAAAGANYKDQVEQQYRQQDAALNQQQVQGEQQQAAQTAAAASQAVNAGLNLVGQGLGEANIGSPRNSGVGDAIKAQQQAAFNNSRNQPTLTAEQLAQSQQTIPAPKPLLTDEEIAAKRNGINKTNS